MSLSFDSFKKPLPIDEFKSYDIWFSNEPYPEICGGCFQRDCQNCSIHETVFRSSKSRGFDISLATFLIDQFNKINNCLNIPTNHQQMHTLSYIFWRSIIDMSHIVFLDYSDFNKLKKSLKTLTINSNDKKELIKLVDMTLLRLSGYIEKC